MLPLTARRILNKLLSTAAAVVGSIVKYISPAPVSKSKVSDPTRKPGTERDIMNPLNLDAVHPSLRESVLQAFNEGDAGHFVFSSERRLAVIADNSWQLKQRGIYEACLLKAFTASRTNLREWSPGVLNSLFAFADKARLRDAGNTIPDQRIFRVYRGVAGRGAARRLRGISWTLSLDVACWFATRYGLANPAVLAADIANEAILAYANERSEQEVLCYPESFQRVKLSLAEIQERGTGHKNQITQSIENLKAALYAKLDKTKTAVVSVLPHASSHGV